MPKLPLPKSSRTPHLSVGDVCHLTGVSRRRLNKWIAAGVVAPIDKEPYLFSLTQVLGLGQARLYSILRQPTSVLRDVAGFLAGYTEPELRREFQRGLTRLRFVIGSGPELYRPRGDEPPMHCVRDVRQLYIQYKEEANQIMNGKLITPNARGGHTALSAAAMRRIGVVPHSDDEDD